jgi:phosphatidylserine decarboxylase
MKSFWFYIVIVILVVFIVLVVLYLLNRYVWFYRDPDRKPEATNRTVIAPADGQIVYIKRFSEGEVASEKLGREIRLDELTDLKLPKGKSGWIIGTYMSPFDVHYNYTPMPGKVKAIAYTKAEANLPMVDLWEYIRFSFLRKAVDNFSERWHLVNERNSVMVEGPGFDYALIEIADKFVNKITCYVSRGDMVEQGDKVGFIDRGSQVDLIIYTDAIEVKVKEGQQVYGGQTTLATY